MVLSHARGLRAVNEGDAFLCARCSASYAARLIGRVYRRAVARGLMPAGPGVILCSLDVGFGLFLVGFLGKLFLLDS